MRERQNYKDILSPNMYCFELYIYECCSGYFLHTWHSLSPLKNAHQVCERSGLLQPSSEAALLCKQNHSSCAIKPWFSFIFCRYKQLRRVACGRAINHPWRWGNKAHMGWICTTGTAQTPAQTTADESSIAHSNNRLYLNFLGGCLSCWSCRST